MVANELKSSNKLEPTKQQQQLTTTTSNNNNGKLRSIKRTKSTSSAHAETNSSSVKKDQNKAQNKQLNKL